MSAIDWVLLGFYWWATGAALYRMSSPTWHSWLIDYAYCLALGGFLLPVAMASAVFKAGSR